MKFQRNKKQNYITIIGSACSQIHKEVNDLSEIEMIKKSNSTYLLYGTKDFCFKKITRLICEPENSDCPGYKGSDDKKHHHKIFGHVPDISYNVYAIDLCAVAYIDFDMKPRKPIITLKQYEAVNNSIQLN